MDQSGPKWSEVDQMVWSTWISNSHSGLMGRVRVVREGETMNWSKSKEKKKKNV